MDCRTTENLNQKSNTNNTSSSDYEDELNDVVGDFNMNMRKFSASLKHNFIVGESEIKRSDYEPFDFDKISSTANNSHKNNYEKLKSKTKKIPESLRRVSFR